MISWSTAYFLSEWVIRLLMLFYVPQQRSPAAARTWLLLIFLLPWPGLVLYHIFGRALMPAHRREQQRVASHYIRRLQQHLGLSGEHVRLPAHLAPAAVLAAKLGDFEMVEGNRAKLLPDYNTAIDALAADIRTATDHVHLLYYIFEDDPTGGKIADALIAAAARGVVCRVLMDDVGSKRGLKRLAPRLRAHRIEVVRMLPVGFFRRNTARFDLRNHRKIAVIDGTTGYVGSQNLVDPFFVPGHPNQELVARVRGPIVHQLQAVFCTDYFLETNGVLDDPRYFPAIPAVGSTPAQLLPGGPGFARANQQELLVSLLHSAREEVVLVTPYFVPDEPFLQAMYTAVDRGVAVHLILSESSNQRVTQYAQMSYYEELLQAGVRVHLYQPGFLHAKHAVIDHEVAVLGSTNLDIRSFALNAEVSMLIYDKDIAGELEDIQRVYMDHSTVLDRREWAARPWHRRMLQNTARLMDSLL